MIDVQHSRFEVLTGYVAAIGLVLSTVIGAAAVQALQGAVHDLQLSAARGLLQGPVYSVVGKLAGVDFTIKREHIPPLIYLAILYLMFNVGYFGSTVYLPLTTATGMLLIFAMIAAMTQSKLLFKKNINTFHSISLATCVIGIFMVVQPPFLFPHDYVLKNISLGNPSGNWSWNYSYTKRTTSEHGLFINSINQTIGYIFSIIGGVSLGMAYDVNAILLCDLRPFVKITYFSNLYVLVSILLALYIEPIVLIMSFNQYMLLLAHAVGAAIATFCNIYASHMIGGVRVSLISSPRILVSLFVQYTFMKSILSGHKNWIEVIGALLLVLGAAISPILDIVRNLKQSNTLP